MPKREARAITLLTRLHRLRQNLAYRVALPSFSDEESSELRKTVREDGALTSGYVLMSALSAGIATLGLLQSSAAVVIGAMLVSPLMSPIAALGFGFASLDGHRIKDAVRVVAVGAIIGILTGMVLTWISPIRNATPEIIARTQPTLLDLAIALLSGIAGGYATVRQKGGTAIGVAIATALMPPLATLGYSIGVANWEFAGGALLLFLTNLAAIAFSFALIARLSGVARPLSHVELTPQYIAAGIGVFVILAIPLGSTLVRVSRETRARSTTRSVLANELKVAPGKVTQLEVKWPLMGQLTIDAVVIEPVFLPNAQQVVNARLEESFGVKPTVNLQQIVASDDGEQTRAMIDAALERNATGVARDVPPYDQIRSKIGLPVQSMWVDRGVRLVHVIPADAPNWTLSDYRNIETNSNINTGDWKIRIVPPTGRTLSIPFGATATTFDSVNTQARDIALWALRRWGIATVTLEVSVRTGDEEAARRTQQRLQSVTSWLDSAKIASVPSIATTRTVTGNDVGINVFPLSPSQLRAARQPATEKPAAPKPAAK